MTDQTHPIHGESDSTAEMAQGKYNLFGGANRGKDQLPPILDTGETRILNVVRAVGLAAGFYLLYVCTALFIRPDLLPSCECWTYIAFVFIFGTLITDRYFRHRFGVHEARREDRSEIENLIIDAQEVGRRLEAHDGGEERPRQFDKKKQQMQNEVERLWKLGPEGWTEYQTLALKMSLIDFKKPEDLKTYSRSLLDELYEYAYDDAYRYDVERFGRWEGRVVGAIEKLEGVEQKLEKRQGRRGNQQATLLEIDEAAEQLRAVERRLVEHITEYDAYWAEGSSFIRDLIIVCIFALFVTLIMGVLPMFYNEQPQLSVFNWAFFGMSGAFTAVLRTLYKSNRVEVGETEGRGELWRAIAGGSLGFVAGFILYFIVAGEVVGAGESKGAAIPNILSSELRDIGLSGILAFGAGYFFEGVLDRIPKPFGGRE